MLVVRIELHHARFPGKVTELGRMIIGNDGSSEDPRRGNYTVRVLRKGFRSVQRYGAVAGFPRKSHNVWRLVLRALASAFPEEKRHVG